jgi:hypothetical protein
VSAVLEQAAPPRQLGFIDSPPEPPHLRLAVIGMLARKPEVRFSGDGRVHLLVEVQQPKSYLPFIAMLHADAEHRVDMEARAATFLAGTPVLMRGECLALTSHRGLEALELRHCDSVSAIAFDQLENT